MVSVRVEGFPSPDAKKKMEVMVNDESEKTSADLSEDKQQDQEIALVDHKRKQLMIKGKYCNSVELQELVGDVQLAVEEEPSEGQEGMKVSSMKSCDMLPAG